MRENKMLARRFHIGICDSTMMLLLLAVLLSSTVCCVSDRGASAPAAPNKSDSIAIPAAAAFDDGQDRAIGSATDRSSSLAVATFLGRQAGASLARFFGSTVADGESEGLLPRTFGRIQKKIYAGLLPVMFKMGILTMIIFTILLLVIKSVLIGKLLLIINLGFVLAKLIAWKQHDSPQHGDWAKSNLVGGGGQNDIHLHIHNAAPAIYPVATPHHQQQHDLPYGAHLQQRGPSIHIEPSSPASSSYGGGYDSSWGGYSQRRQQTGNEYAYVDTAAMGYPPPQSNPVYIPNTRFKR